MRPVLAVGERKKLASKLAVYIGELIIKVQATAHVIAAVIVVSPLHCLEVALQSVVRLDGWSIEISTSLLEAIEMIEKLLADVLIIRYILAQEKKDLIKWTAERDEPLELF